MDNGDGGSLVTLAIYAVIGLAIVGTIIWQVMKRSRAMRAPIGDDECVSCDSRNVTLIGPGIYRCQDCGYEGGPGIAARQAQSQAAAIEQMSPEARRSSGIQDLQEARTMLMSVAGSSDSLVDASGSVASMRSNLTLAKQQLQNASLKLQDPHLAQQPDQVRSDVAGDAVANLAEQGVGGAIVGGALASSDIGGMKQEAVRLLQLIDAALTHHTGATPAEKA